MRDAGEVVGGGKTDLIRVTILVGENATGKSTLLEAIADNCEFRASGGSRDHAEVGPDTARSPLAPIAASRMIAGLCDASTRALRQ